MSTPYPFVNGTRHEWSSIEIKIGAQVILGFKAISYKDSLKPTKVYGTPTQPIGRTRGVYLAEGSFEMYANEFDDLVWALGGDGYAEQAFNITCAYTENGLNQIVDTLVGCRIAGVDRAAQQGAEALTRKVELDIMNLLDNGRSAVLRSIVAPPSLSLVSNALGGIGGGLGLSLAA